jgi:hypothetical protein
MMMTVITVIMMAVSILNLLSNLALWGQKRAPSTSKN